MHDSVILSGDVQIRAGDHERDDLLDGRIQIGAGGGVEVIDALGDARRIEHQGALRAEERAVLIHLGDLGGMVDGGQSVDEGGGLVAHEHHVADLGIIAVGVIGARVGDVRHNIVVIRTERKGFGIFRVAEIVVRQQARHAPFELVQREMESFARHVLQKEQESDRNERKKEKTRRDRK